MAKDSPDKRPQRHKEERSDFRTLTDAKLRFFWMCWAILAVVCFASLTVSIIALRSVRDFKRKTPPLISSDTSSPQEADIASTISDGNDIYAKTLEGQKYQILTHNLTVLSKKYMKMFRSMKEMLEDHEKSPTGHASGSIKVELDKLRADFNDVLKKYVKRKGNKFLKQSTYEKSSTQLRNMMQRLDNVVNDLLEQVKRKLGVAQFEQEAIRLGFLRTGSTTSNGIRASEMALYVKTELGQYVKYSQLDTIFKRANFTVYFTQQLNDLKRTYMTKRSAKTYVDMQAHESREALVVRLNEHMSERLNTLRDNINSRISVMHRDVQVLTKVMSPSQSNEKTPRQGACTDEASAVLTSLAGHFEPGAWDLEAEKKIEMIRRFRQLQEEFFTNQTEQVTIIEDQRRKLEENVNSVTNLYSDMDASLQSGLNKVRLQIQQNAQELERISGVSEDLQKRQKSTHSALTKFKTASYRMMATKADFDSLSQQTQHTKTGLRELKDITVRSLSKDMNELKENDLKILKYQVIQLSQRLQEVQKVSDSVQSNRFQAGQNTLTEMEGFKSKLTNLEQVLTSLYQEVQNPRAKEAI